MKVQLWQSGHTMKNHLNEQLSFFEGRIQISVKGPQGFSFDLFLCVLIALIIVDKEAALDDLLTGVKTCVSWTEETIPLCSWRWRYFDNCSSSSMGESTAERIWDPDTRRKTSLITPSVEPNSTWTFMWLHMRNHSWRMEWFMTWNTWKGDWYDIMSPLI